MSAPSTVISEDVVACTGRIVEGRNRHEWPRLKERDAAQFPSANNPIQRQHCCCSGTFAFSKRQLIEERRQNAIAAANGMLP